MTCGPISTCPAAVGLVAAWPSPLSLNPVCPLTIRSIKAWGSRDSRRGAFRPIAWWRAYPSCLVRRFLLLLCNSQDFRNGYVWSEDEGRQVFLLAGREGLG